MINDLWLIGIGTGSLTHLTHEGLQALRDASVILVPRKGTGKDDLADIRLKLISQAQTNAEIIFFEYPTRDPSLPYIERVAAWHREIALRWQAALEGQNIAGPVALLIWGDPSLYDSTMRIAGYLSPRPKLRVIPGVTSLQALTAAHAIPFNTVNGNVLITTGRRLRDEGWPAGSETVIVMLDGEASFQHLTEPNLHIWWGAYLGMQEQIIDAGPLPEVAQRIAQTRAAAREAHGWIMDTYLLRKGGETPG
ncbi:precorrin-6A synthase (deacetylating) [Lentibacter algarum]|uniref:precorrin-6A synthase (deacetylating) n=1 Tax=Lentibacter algarum TaxID=576131 RepID=UPI001C06F951|nr:precorrin-6A synthase (deacetylating) [Lentibacter algarum]MBU2981645.1 precorrin-6A synthase (deacetylating) [Lentibacter algarum]